MESYITHLHAQNTGVFEKLDIFFNKGFNFIVGPNGCGKTSILKCIALCLNPSDSKVFRYGDNAAVWFDAIHGDENYRVGLGEGWVSNIDAYRESRHQSWTQPPAQDGLVSISVHDLEQKDINISPLILGAYRRIEYRKIEGMHREQPAAAQ